MSAELVPGTDAASTPNVLPPLLAVPARRPGRVRGTFTLHALEAAGAAAPPATRHPADPETPTPPAMAPSAMASPGQAVAAPARSVQAPPVVSVFSAPARRAATTADPGEIDWGLVTALRTAVASRLSRGWGDDWHDAPPDGPSPQPPPAGGKDVAAADREVFAREVIHELLTDHTREAFATGQPAWSPAQQEALASAVFDAVFRLGRLQPLVDDVRVENIFILGHDRVFLELVDGTRIPGPPVADSDEELIDFLRFLAARSESNPRPFSQATPTLHLKLDGGARLAATAWVVSRPTVVIRRHRLKVDTLQAWVERGCMSPSCANFLAAAVKAGRSITVSGAMSAGKTTLVRALCAQIPYGEAIGTFETEHELFLAESGNHEIVIDWEARPGVGEIGADGRAAGAFDLPEALSGSFRFALSRQIVGEIRGAEVWTMIKAAESTTGSLSTTHAADAASCIRKLVTCAMEFGANVTRDLAVEKVAGALDVIVQLRRHVDTGPEGTTRLRRWVSEVVLVEPGEKEIGYALTHVFGPGHHGPATATGILPAACTDLAGYGFDEDLYQGEADNPRWAS